MSNKDVYYSATSTAVKKKPHNNNILPGLQTADFHFKTIDYITANEEEGWKQCIMGNGSSQGDSKCI